MNNASAVQNRSWLGALASGVKALVAMLMNLIGVVDEGLSMADVAVKTAREKQAVDLTISMDDYVVNAVARASMERDMVQESVNTYTKGDQKRIDSVQKNHDRLKKLVEDELARIKASRLVS